MHHAADFFYISVGVIFCSMILYVIRSKAKSHDSKNTTFLPFAIGGVFVSAILMLFPLYYHTYSELPNQIVHSLFSSAHHALQLFTIDADR